MKKIFILSLVLLFVGIIVFISCKKEYSCEGCINGNKPPIANAGPDQAITLPTDSVSLDGTASSDPDGTISSFLWTKISGPVSFNINNVSVAKTVVKNLAAGIYQFELKVKDNGGLSAKDTVQVIVNDLTNPDNRPPVANAGADQTIALPTNTVTLDGSGSTDPDNDIASYEWTKISGPSSFNIAYANAAQTQVTNLVQGVYQFELKVTDSGGLFSKDTVVINVNSAGNRPPVANAGPDLTITLPTNTVTLNGSGSTDPDNNITNYLWTKISGPSSFSIANVNAAQTQVNNLVQGVYQFELKVTDAGGLFSKDTMQVNVNSITPGSCPPINRPTINAQLVPFGNLSMARGGIASVSAGNKLFFAGGTFASGGCASRVDIYNETTQSWSTAELSIARISPAAIANQNKVFFAGGWACDSWGRSSRVDIYDLSTNTWTTAELSEPRGDIVTAAVGNKVFFAGGNLSTALYDPSNRIDVYDISSNSWSTASLSETRIGFTATTAGNKIYFTGGWNGIDGSVASTKIDIYDNATNSWSVSALSSPKAYMASIFKNGKIYWAGGSSYVDWANDNIWTCDVEVRDVNTQVTSFTNLSWQYWGFDAFERNNDVVYLMKWPWTFSPLPLKFDIYDSNSNTWSIGFLNQYIPGGACIVSSNNTIYVAGGNNGYNSQRQDVSQVWKLEF